MPIALKQFLIAVTHPQSREMIEFYGQGTTVLEAVNDGVKNCGDIFRPNQSGSAAKPGEKGGPRRVAAKKPDGSIVFKSLREFEADVSADSGERQGASSLPAEAVGPAKGNSAALGALQNQSSEIIEFA